MSAIDRVREKFQTPMSGGSKGSKSPSAGSAASLHRDSEIHGHPSTGSAGALHRDSEKLSSRPHGACATCTHFEKRPGDSPPGHCRRFKVSTDGAYADGCADGWTPAAAVVRALERRRAEVIARLKADPALRYSFDVQGASPIGPARGPVSVVLAVRDSTGAIVSGELRVPAERWPGLALFTEYWRDCAEARLS